MKRSWNAVSLIVCGVVACALVGAGALAADGDAKKSDAKPADAKKIEAKKQGVNPSGTWRWQRERNGQTMKSSLDVSLKEGGKVEGVLHAFNQELKSKEGTIEGDKLILKFEAERDGDTYKLELTGTVKGNEITGTIKFSGGDQSREFPWNPKRDAAVADLTGKWDLRIETSGGDIFTPKLEIVKKDGKLEGTYTWQDKKIPVKELNVDGDKLGFTVVAELDGQELTAKYQGQARGAKMTGKIDYKLGEDTGTVDFTGKKAAQK